MLRELNVWLKLRDPTIVPLLGTARVVESPLLAFVSQLMPSGKLYDYICEQTTTITLTTRVKLVSYLFHTNHIQQALINFRAARSRVLLRASNIVSRCLLACRSSS